jgi:hypothetical protein
MFSMKVWVKMNSGSRLFVNGLFGVLLVVFLSVFVCCASAYQNQRANYKNQYANRLRVKQYSSFKGLQIVPLRTSGGAQSTRNSDNGAKRHATPTERFNLNISGLVTHEHNTDNTDNDVTIDTSGDYDCSVSESNSPSVVLSSNSYDISERRKFSLQLNRLDMKSLNAQQFVSPQNEQSSPFRGNITRNSQSSSLRGNIKAVSRQDQLLNILRNNPKIVSPQDQQLNLPNGRVKTVSKSLQKEPGFVTSMSTKEKSSFDCIRDLSMVSTPRRKSPATGGKFKNVRGRVSTGSNNSSRSARQSPLTIVIEDAKISNKGNNSPTKKIKMSNKGTNSPTEKIKISNKRYNSPTEKIKISNKRYSSEEIKISNKRYSSPTEEIKISSERGNSPTEEIKISNKRDNNPTEKIKISSTKVNGESAHVSVGLDTGQPTQTKLSLVRTPIRGDTSTFTENLTDSGSSTNAQDKEIEILKIKLEIEKERSRTESIKAELNRTKRILRLYRRAANDMSKSAERAFSPLGTGGLLSDSFGDSDMMLPGAMSDRTHYGSAIVNGRGSSFVSDQQLSPVSDHNSWDPPFASARKNRVISGSNNMPLFNRSVRKYRKIDFIDESESDVVSESLPTSPSGRIDNKKRNDDSLLLSSYSWMDDSSDDNHLGSISTNKKLQKVLASSCLKPKKNSDLIDHDSWKRNSWKRNSWKHERVDFSDSDQLSSSSYLSSSSHSSIGGNIIPQDLLSALSSANSSVTPREQISSSSHSSASSKKNSSNSSVSSNIIQSSLPLSSTSSHSSVSSNIIQSSLHLSSTSPHSSVSSNIIQSSLPLSSTSSHSSVSSNIIQSSLPLSSTSSNSSVSSNIIQSSLPLSRTSSKRTSTSPHSSVSSNVTQSSLPLSSTSSHSSVSRNVTQSSLPLSSTSSKRTSTSSNSSVSSNITRSRPPSPSSLSRTSSDRERPLLLRGIEQKIDKTGDSNGHNDEKLNLISSYK